MPALNTRKFDRLLDALHGTTSPNNLRTVGRRIFREHGIKTAGYRHIPPRGAKQTTPQSLISSIGFRPDWIKRFCDKRYYEVSKFVSSAMHNSEPRKWTDFQKSADLNERERAMLADFTRYNPGRGIVIPVFGPHERNGVFTIGFGPNCEPPSGITIPELQFVSQILHHRLCCLVQREIFDAIKLSKRERDVLEKIAIGQSTREIAADLGIKTSTVDTYVRRIFDKLNVSSRNSAVLRASALGLI